MRPIVMRPIGRLLASVMPLFLLGLVPWGCARAPAADEPSAEERSAHAQAVADWRNEYTAGLTAEDGWLSLVGLHWLEVGQHRCGAADTAAVPLPANRADAEVGVFELAEDGSVHFTAAPGADVRVEGAPVDQLTLVTDAQGAPTMLAHGTLRFYSIVRGERTGIRVKDLENPAIAAFHGIDTYPTAWSWRAAGRFEPHPEPMTIPVPTILGTFVDMESPGFVLFERDGRTLRLAALPAGEGQLWLIFGDDTNGEATYGGGRFLYIDGPDETGAVVIDFNRSYNPPCAYTTFATCPLPPPQNKLDVAVEAGEKRYADHA